MWNEFQDYIFLGLDGLVVCVLYKIYKSRDEVIKNILEAPSVTVGPELHKLLAEGDIKNDVPYAILRGRVEPFDGTIQSPTGLKGVLQMIKLTEHSVRRHAFGHWGDSVRVIHESQNSVPFAMKNLATSGSSDIKVEVENPFDASMENLLLPVSTNFSPTNSTVASTVMGFFTGHAPKGIETTEDLLPMDTVITGVGRVVQDTSGHIKICEPINASKYPFILSTLPIESIVKRLENRNFYIKLTTCLFASLGIFIAARRLSQWWKLRKSIQAREKILRNRSTRNLDALSELETCIICLTNPREILLMDCGHVAVCDDCSHKLKSKCPICRMTIKGTHPAYLA